MAVFVLDRHHKPLMPCSEKRARLLLERGRARVHKMAPFTIRLGDRLQEESALQSLRLKLDPGSKTTGVAVILDGAKGAKGVFLGEVVHKPGIKAKLDARRAIRRSRRHRKTRYRQARFLNRRLRQGWLPPSLEARVNQMLSAVMKLMASMPITAISTEHVKFDTQLMQNPEISGVEYQQGELVGYEVREYLLEKWGRACAYCGATDVPLETEHIVPRSRGGSDRVSNLTLACHECNQEKGNQTAGEYGFPHIQEQAKKPLRDAAMMNATRWRLLEELKEIGLPVECGTGARTKMQRIAHDLPKEHYYDALCVGKSTPEAFTSLPAYVHVWKAEGRGTRMRMNIDAYGFPIVQFARQKRHFGFQTGDFVEGRLVAGNRKGLRVKGRVNVRSNGRFVVMGKEKIEPSYKNCRLIQRGDGWSYGQEKRDA